MSLTKAEGLRCPLALTKGVSGSKPPRTSGPCQMQRILGPSVKPLSILVKGSNMPKRHRTPAPETTFRPGPRDDISTKNPWKTRKNPAACGGRQNSTQGLLWEQMWTSTTGTPEAAEENFAPPPRGSLLVKFRQNRGAPLGLALCHVSNYCRIP